MHKDRVLMSRDGVNKSVFLLGGFAMENAYRSTPPTGRYFPLLDSTTTDPVICGCKEQKYG
jgi:hypothetical protein